jgi:hypothetical protein
MLVGLAVQLVGAAALLVGLTWALGPWALAAGGLVLLVVPELLERPGRSAEDVGESAEWEAGKAPRPRPTLPDPGIPERVSRRERRRRAA